MLVRSLTLVLLVAALAACDDLKDFAGTRSAGIVGGGFVRSCFKSDTQLTLAFDPNLTTPLPDGGFGAIVNTISTSDGTFQETKLEPISRLPHDPLSELDFPGPQRLRNYMMLARPGAGPLAGRDALVVISLLASEALEVRIIARSADGVSSCPSDLEVADAAVVPGPVDPAGGVIRREYFGLWRIKKHP